MNGDNEFFLTIFDEGKVYSRELELDIDRFEAQSVHNDVW